MTYKGIFIDDQEQVYAETLTTLGKLEFEFLPVEEVVSLARKMLAEQPAIVAIDYRLDEAPAGLEADQTYKGSGLAQHLRDASIEHPERDFAMVLVSAENKIRTLYRPDKTAHDLFDRVYVKEDINRRRTEVRGQLVSLCAGYERLRTKAGKYDVVELMAAGEDDRPYIDSQDLRTKLSEATAPHIASRILFSLIDRPGPLLDMHDVCAHLGISYDQAGAIAERLECDGLAYKGLYAEAWPRWWAHRLERWALAVFKRRATGLPAADRAKLLRQATGHDFEPARSPWNGSPNELIAFACASCERGTELRHSVAAFEPFQPRWAMRRRICWDCIQSDQYEAHKPPLAVDDADQDLALRIKTLNRAEDEAEGDA